MGIREQEDLLFDLWASARPGLVRDGVVEESAFLASRPRLLFVLKEVNDSKDGGGWDLREFLREGGRPRTWDTVTRWVEGIRELHRDFYWTDLQEVSEERRKAALSSIAAVNLKKSPGVHTANADLIREIAQQDQSWLQAQFALYDPDIVICCGTGDWYDGATGVSSASWVSTSRGIAYRRLATGGFVVSFTHPEARAPASLLYYGLIDAVREINSFDGLNAAIIRQKGRQ